MDARSSLWEQALCANTRDDTFFSDGDGGNYYRTRRAIDTCKTPCPILNECLIYAFQHHPLHGVWGATTARQRKKIMKERKAAA